MKGKIAFVLGAAVGYVLGSRAGRERYEQIKRGADQLWNTAPVQRGVGVVRDATRGTVENLKDSALQAGKNAFASMVGGQDRSTSSSNARTASASTAPQSPNAAPKAAPKPVSTSTPPAAPKPTAKPKSGEAAKPGAGTEADAKADTAADGAGA